MSHWTKQAAWQICEKVVEAGFEIKSYQQAETTHSIYLTLRAESGHIFGVRISDHPKPGYSRMVSKGGHVYCSSLNRAALVAEKIVANPCAGIIPKHDIWQFRANYTNH